MGQKAANLTNLVYLAVICGAICLVYANSLGGAFLFDDYTQIVNNPYIKDAKYLGVIFTSGFGRLGRTGANYYRPLLESSYMVDRILWRDSVYGCHMTNIFFHLAGAVVLFFLLNRLFARPRVSFLTSLLFGIHPIYTSAVTYLSGRGDTMQIFFILLSLFWLVRFADTKERFSRPFLAASVFCFFLALLTKEASAFFAVIALLYGWGAAGRVKTPEGKRRFFRIAVFFSCAVILYFLLRVNALKCVFQPRYNIASCADVFTRYATSVKAFGEYLVILAAPVGLRFERTIPLASSPFEPQVLFGLLALAALGYAAFRLRGTKGAGFFGISWFLLNFIPVSNLLFPLNAFIAENWIQLPAIGVFLAVSSLAAGLFERFKGRALSRWLMVCLFIGIIIFYASLTVVRNFQYHDPIRWYLDAIRREPASVKLFNNMGVEYERRKDFDAAAEFYRKALELNPGHVTSLNNLANIYSANGRFDEAIELYKKALEAVPDNIFYMNNLGVAYIRKGDRESAVYWWKRSLGLNPDQPRIREYIEWNR